MNKKASIRAALVACLFLVLIGCGSNSPEMLPRPCTSVSAPALWDVGYVKALQDNPQSDEFLQEVSLSLLLRTTSPEFWELAEIVTRHGKTADYIIFSEHMYNRHYWYGALVVEGRHLVLYSSHRTPFQDESSKASGYPTEGRVWKQSHSGNAVQLIAMLSANGEWRNVRRQGFGGGGTHPNPFFIHMFGRSEGGLSLMVDSNFVYPLDMDVITGRTDFVLPVATDEPSSDREFAIGVLYGLLRTLYKDTISK